MKAFIVPSYTFTPGDSGVGTVNLSGISGFNIKYLVAIINQTRGIVIYATGSLTTRYTDVTGTTVTLFADTTGQSSGDVLQVIYEDVSTPVPSSLVMAGGGNLSLTTNATGSLYTAFSSQACRQATISNQTGTTIEVQQDGAGAAFQLPTGSFYTFFGITNANQLGVRRVDQSNTQVTVTARWES